MFVGQTFIFTVQRLTSAVCIQHCEMYIKLSNRFHNGFNFFHERQLYKEAE